MTIEEVKEALLTAQALYAVVLGKKADAEKTEQEVETVLKEARVKFEEMIAQGRIKIAEAQEATQKAAEELEKYQAESRERLGIVVDLMPKPPGGHTRL